MKRSYQIANKTLIKECNTLEGTLSRLTQFLANESPLKMLKNAF